MSEPDWREVHQDQIHRKTERWKKINKDLGLGLNERKIEQFVREKQRDATEKVLRERLHEPGHKK